MDNVTEVVIKIPDEAFEAFKKWHKDHVATVEQSIIANGTVLPKGHGDLIDRDKLSPQEYSPKAIWSAILKAPTIVEADKG